jgi:hypothetical protein
MPKEVGEDSAYAKYIAPKAYKQSVRLKDMERHGHTIPKKQCDQRGVDSGDGMVKSCSPCFEYCKAKDNAIVNEKRFPCTSNAYISNNIQRLMKADFHTGLTY